MEVGNYVRTKYGIIAKITNIIEDLSIDCDIDVFYEGDLKDTNPMMEIPYYLKDEYIIKSSSNIADLILPMDLMYIDISPDNCGGIVVPRIPETYCELEQIINEIKLGNYILKGIVTKEQLMENMYNLESEVN